MSPEDQAELVALTSMYGLPVIASKDKQVSSQIEPPGKDYVSDADDKTPMATICRSHCGLGGLRSVRPVPCWISTPPFRW